MSNLTTPTVAPNVIATGITTHLLFMTDLLPRAGRKDRESMRHTTIEILKSTVPGIGTMTKQLSIEVGRKLADYLKDTFHGDEPLARKFIKDDPGAALIGSALLAVNPELARSVPMFDALAKTKQNGAHNPAAREHRPRAEQSPGLPIAHGAGQE